MRENALWAGRRLRDAFAVGFLALVARISHDNVMPGACHGEILRAARSEYFDLTLCGLMYHEMAVLQAVTWGLAVTAAIQAYRWQNRRVGE